jgi:hypothetical protein
VSPFLKAAAILIFVATIAANTGPSKYTNLTADNAIYTATDVDPLSHRPV